MATIMTEYMQIQNRDYTINSDGTLSIKSRTGSMVVVSGKVLGNIVKIENIQVSGSGYKVTANGMTLDIASSDADKLISFVDIGSPVSFKRQGAGFLEPSISLIKVREISQNGDVTDFDTSIQEPGMSTIKKVVLIGAMFGTLYFIYRRYIRD